MRRNAVFLILAVVLGCFIMGLVDAVLRPGYWIKSGCKLVVFLSLPMLWTQRKGAGSLHSLFQLKKGRLRACLSCGLGVYALILGAYFVLQAFLDPAAITGLLGKTAAVNRDNFIFVALYISFVNSFLEEFFFRGFAYLKLRELVPNRAAACFSAFLFALYHVAMMMGWFPLPVFLLALGGLFVGGLLFNWVDSRTGSLYLSWIIHMFANFAINTVGLMMFGIF